MTIDEAIRRLQRYVKYRKPDLDDNFHESIKLGIEALKHYQEVRPLKVSRYYPLLPGETEE